MIAHQTGEAQQKEARDNGALSVQSTSLASLGAVNMPPVTARR